MPTFHSLYILEDEGFGIEEYIKCKLTQHGINIYEHLLCAWQCARPWNRVPWCHRTYILMGKINFK